ncbi:MAG: hypothetical protein IIB42_09190, partial [Candidatus Marinimicrobia bacterium]|nr:hypothetical protein [Candidatus Neomarinimicrobiota bacterium]
DPAREVALRQDTRLKPAAGTWEQARPSQVPGQGVVEDQGVGVLIHIGRIQELKPDRSAELFDGNARGGHPL